MRVRRRSCSARFVARIPCTYSSVPSGVPRTRRPWRSRGRDGVLAVAAQVGDVSGLLPRCVPYAGFATVEFNARVLAKCPLAGVLQFPDALGHCDDINVVEVGKDRFALTRLRVNGCESRVLSDGVEGGLRLPHLVALPAGVLPHVRAVGSVELAHVRQQRCKLVLCLRPASIAWRDT